MEKNTGKKVVEVSKEEFAEMISENKELMNTLIEFMDSTVELKLIYSELMDISIALDNWLIGDCLEKMGNNGCMKVVMLKRRIDNVISKELSKRGIEVD